MGGFSPVGTHATRSVRLFVRFILSLSIRLLPFSSLCLLETYCVLSRALYPACVSTGDESVRPWPRSENEEPPKAACGLLLTLSGPITSVTQDGSWCASGGCSLRNVGLVSEAQLRSCFQLPL